MTATEIMSNIDGPIFREQRRVVLQLLDSKFITSDQQEALEGLTVLLDDLADFAYAIYDKDCLLTESELKEL